MRAKIELSPGDLVDGRYRILRVLGSGGAGAVYAASDESSGNDTVAIKVLASGDDLDDEQRSGLELEFSLLARLGHPNVVSALNIGVGDNGRTYLVEELVEGPTLEAVRETLEPTDYFWIAHGILEGLAHVHRRGWVHHDIKPANILIAGTKDGPPRTWTPKIADLGVASLRGSDPEGRVSGTVPFLSPERLIGQLADPRSDVWALGMTLLYCVSGTLPVDVDSVRAAARILSHGRVPALRDLRSDAPAELEVVIGRMLARDGRSRYRDGADALAGLRREMSRAGFEPPELLGSTLAQTPALIGRDQAIADVLGQLEPRRGPRARVVAVAGPPGSGRSRLLAEVALEVQLRGARAVFVDPGVGLEPWRRAAAQLGMAAESPRIDAIAATLSAALERRAAVLLVDDVDARDGVARRLLERMQSSLPAADHVAGLVVAGGLTGGWLDAIGGDAVELADLDDEEAEKLVLSALGDDVAPQAVVRLKSVGGGNPGRLLATMKAAVASGALKAVAGSWELAADLTSLAAEGGPREAIAALGDTNRRLMLALAVLGPGGAPVELELAREVADHPRSRFAPAIAALCHLGLARLSSPAQTVVNSVVLAPHADQAALEVGDAEEIRALHGRALRQLFARGSSDSAVLARHAWGAGLEAEAAELTSDAALGAITAGDYASVLALTDPIAERFDDLTLDVAQRLRVARAHSLVELSRPLDGAKLAASVMAIDRESLPAAQIIVRASIAAGDSVRAERGLGAVKAIRERGLGDARDDVEIAALDVEVARLTQRPDEVETVAKASLEIIDTILETETSDAQRVATRRARGRVLTAVGASLALGGNIPVGRVHLEAALEVFDELSDDARIAEVTAFLAAAADLSGEDEERAQHLKRGLESAERAGADSSAARLLNIRGLSLLWTGRTDEAGEAFVEAERRGRRAGLYKVVSAVSGNLVVVHRRAGHYAEALDAAARSLRIKRPLGDRRGVVATTLNLADVFFDLGRYRISSAAARRVVRESIAMGQRRVEVNGRVTLATALAARGLVHEARDALDWVVEGTGALEHHAELEVQLAIAMVLAAERELSRSADLYRAIEKEARHRDEPYVSASAAYYRGVLLGGVGAADLRRSIDSAARCSARHLLWMARAQLGMILASQGEDDRAGAEFARASETLEAVLGRMLPRHREQYTRTPERLPLVAAIRSGARFPDKVGPMTGGAKHSTSSTTIVDAPTGSVTAPTMPTPGAPDPLPPSDQVTRDVTHETEEQRIEDTTTEPVTGKPDRE